VLLLGGCAGLPPVADGRAQFAAAAALPAWTPHTHDVQALQLKGLYKGFSGAPGDLVVYLEGDGHAWANRFTPSRDPTPQDAVALKLALQHAGAKVLYLARPCQFLDRDALAACDARYWTSHRYAPDVIAAFNQVLDEAKQRMPSNRLRLVGYSGGAPLALLLAAHRDDVVSVVTVAGNLDPAAWSAYHGISPPRGSLNPRDFLHRLSTVPQQHFVGGKDQIVPPVLVKKFIAQLGTSPMIRLWIEKAFDHRCCWARDWDRLQRRLEHPHN